MRGGRIGRGGSRPRGRNRSALSSGTTERRDRLAWPARGPTSAFFICDVAPAITIGGANGRTNPNITLDSQHGIYRVKNPRILPVLGAGTRKLSPRVGHLHEPSMTCRDIGGTSVITTRQSSWLGCRLASTRC